jgi:quinol monooxygenase YgiN
VGPFSWQRLKEFVCDAVALDFPQACRAACISERRYDVWRRFAVEPSPENARMIHVFATITTQPGQREAVLALFNKNRPAVLAETGCISYEAVVDVPDFGGFQTPLGNDTFAVVERWESTEALKAHAASAHMAVIPPHCWRSAQSTCSTPSKRCSSRPRHDWPFFFDPVRVSRRLPRSQAINRR